jgi:dipeptidyl-peptidase 4
MLKRIWFVPVLFSFTLILEGQKADFKAAEKFRSDNLITKYGDLAVNASWIDGKDVFWYSFKTSAGKEYYIVDAATRTKKKMFDTRYLAGELRNLMHKPYNELDLPVTDIRFEKKSVSRFCFKADSVEFLFDISTQKLTLCNKNEKRIAAWATYSPDSTMISYCKNNNLFIMKADDADSVEIQLTKDGECYHSYGENISDTTKNKKMKSSAVWFGNSKKLYIERTDERKVKDLYVVDVLSEPRPKLESYKYSMPGDKDVPQTSLEIFDVSSGKRTEVDIAKWKDQTIKVAWASQKKSAKLIVLRKDRLLKNLDVCSVNAETGQVNVLFSEESCPYFNNEYSKLYVLNEGKDLIWWSERTGWGQLYLYDGNGKLKNQITNGYFVTGKIERIDTLSRMVYFEAFGRENGVHPYYSMKYKANIDHGNITLLTSEPATHSFSMSGSGKYFVDTYSTVEKVPQSVLRDNNGNVLMKLETPDLSQLFATGWKMPEVIKVKAKDGVTDLYGVMYKPFDFDSTKKYPVISYVYPGPQTEAVQYAFSVSGGKNVALAQLGFIVVNFGHRGGSPMRNNYYHTYGYNDLRDYPLADDKYGIEQLADRYKFIDINRVGIYGHSGGGFMAAAAILSYPDFYKVAVSSSGNHDNNIYNQWWCETYNGVTETETDDQRDAKGDLSGKHEGSVRFKGEVEKNQDIAANLKGNLLLVTGDIDNNVHPGNTLRLVDALIKANKRFDFMMLPGQRHSYGNDVPYFDRMMWYYFAQHLLDDYRTNVDLTNFDSK